MTDNVATADCFRELFLSNTPFLDVRAEVEFAKGHFPTSQNIPILNDSERQSVGTCYKQKGKQAAVELGHQLVAGATKEARIEAWCDYAKQHANTHVYCWRGGMRSNYARQWMRDAGVEIPVVEGGYKALRRVLIDEISAAAAQTPMLRIGGKTGTGKTLLVNEIDFSIDLEGHANHRGSSFGRRVSGSPTQVLFENALGIDLLRKRQVTGPGTLIVEDESRRIGAVSIPQEFFETMHTSPVAVVEMPVDFRIQRILQEYVIDMTAEFLEAYPQDGRERFADYLTQSLARVQKRLGLERYTKLSKVMEYALNTQFSNGSVRAHESWIAMLLSDYYDPMCEYQLDKQTGQIAFRGSYDDVLAWAREVRRKPAS